MLHSRCQQIWKTQQWPQDWKRSVFHSNPKERQCQRVFKLRTIALISQASKEMLKILQARLQQYMNRKLPDVQARFRKGRGTRDQIANIKLLDHWKSKRVPEKHLLLYYWLHQSLWLFGSQQTVENYYTGIPGLTRPLRKLHAGQEATVRTEHGTTNWFKIGKWLHQGCILSSCLFNICAECIMLNARLDKAHARIKMAGRNINNHR